MLNYSIRLVTRLYSEMSEQEKHFTKMYVLEKTVKDKNKV